jgi:hypothetical protein
MTHLIARIEIYYESEENIIVVIYSKDAIHAICSRFVKAYNATIKTYRDLKFKWKGIPLESFMILFKGTVKSLTKVFGFYILENTQPDDECSRFVIPEPKLQKLFTYPFKYLFYMVCAAISIKRFLDIVFLIALN